VPVKAHKEPGGGRKPIGWGWKPGEKRKKKAEGGGEGPDNSQSSLVANLLRKGLFCEWLLTGASAPQKTAPAKGWSSTGESSGRCEAEGEGYEKYVCLNWRREGQKGVGATPPSTPSGKKAAPGKTAVELGGKRRVFLWPD